MEWIGIVGVIVGGGLTQLGNLVSRMWNRSDKRQERTAQLGDQHRLELKQAYVEFIGSYNHMLDVCALFSTCSSARDQQRQEAYEEIFADAGDATTATRAASKAGNPDLIIKVRELLDEMTRLSTETEAKSIGLRLLEDDPKRSELIASISCDLLTPPLSQADYAPFVEELKRRQVLVRSLVNTLGGAFSARRLLPSGSTTAIQLRPGS